MKVKIINRCFNRAVLGVQQTDELFEVVFDDVGHWNCHHRTSDTRGRPGYRRIELEEARARVKLLESAYLSTLQHMHRRYFDGNERAPVPSNVLEDVFRRVDYDNGTKSRWIAVNTPAMDPKHEPNDLLTKEIASFLKANNKRYEKVVDDKLVSGRAITLFANCQKCHVSALTQQNGGRKVAGLIIEIPLVYKLALEE